MFILCINILKTKIEQNYYNLFKIPENRNQSTLN